MMLRRFMNGFWISMVIVGSVVSIGGYGVVEAKDMQTTKVSGEIQQNAEEFIQNLGNRAIEVIKRSGITEKEVQQEFCSLLKENFAVESIAKYSLGKNFRLLSEEEKKDFVECFEKMLVRFYSSRFSEYNSAKFEVVADHSKKRTDKKALINSKVTISSTKDKKNKEIFIKWTVFFSKGSLKIYDVAISDVSISNVQRSEFMSQISKKGLKRFLADFRKKYGQNEEQKQ